MYYLFLNIHCICIYIYIYIYIHVFGVAPDLATWAPEWSIHPKNPAQGRLRPAQGTAQGTFSSPTILFFCSATLKKRVCLGKTSAQGSAQDFRTRSCRRHPHKVCTRLSKPCGAQGRPSAHKDFFSVGYNIYIYIYSYIYIY